MRTDEVFQPVMIKSTLRISFVVQVGLLTWPELKLLGVSNVNTLQIFETNGPGLK